MAQHKRNITDHIRKIRKHLNDVRSKKRESFAHAEIPHIKHNKKRRAPAIVEIAPASVARAAAIVLLILLGFFVFYEIRSILFLFFIAFLFASALDPFIDKFEEWRIPRALGALIVYIIIFLFSGFFVTQVATLIAEQITGIIANVGAFVGDGSFHGIENLPFGKELKPYLQQFAETVNIQDAAVQLQSAFQFVSAQIVNISLGLMNTLIVIVLTFFMVVEEQSIEDFFRSLFPVRYADYVSTRITAVKDYIGLWLRGQIVVSFIAGLLSYIGLAMMGIDYALTISLIAGICMIIPVVGRVFAWVITLPIVFQQDPSLAAWMSIYYLIIQQFENNLIVPYVMNRAVGLNPIIIIFALMVGGQYYDILGFVLAIPVATTVAIFVKDYTRRSE